MTKRIYITAAGILLILLSYFFLDQPIAHFFQHTNAFLRFIAKFFSSFTGPTPNVLLWPLIFYATRFFFKKEHLANKFLFIAISVNLTAIIAVGLKMLLGRYRPDMLFAKGLYGWDFLSGLKAELSFPSAHAATIAAVLFSLAWIYPRYFYHLGAAAFILSLERVVLTDHYLSDVIAGLLLGMWISRAVYLSMKEKSLNPFSSKFL